MSFFSFIHYNSKRNTNQHKYATILIIIHIYAVLKVFLTPEKQKNEDCREK